jgi:hypothetical protein
LPSDWETLNRQLSKRAYILNYVPNGEIVVKVYRHLRIMYHIVRCKAYLHTPTDCSVQQKIGLILCVKIVSYDTFRWRATQFSLRSVGLCQYPIIQRRDTGAVKCLKHWLRKKVFLSTQMTAVVEEFLYSWIFLKN